MTTVIDLPVSTLPFRIDPIRPSDRADVQRLFAACSDATVQNRFRARLPAFPARHLDELLAGPPERHDALAVRGRADGKLIALGSLAAPYHGSDGRTAELGLLVVDGWQRRGVGRALIAALVARAARRGTSRLVAEVPHGRGALLQAMGRGLPLLSRTCDRDGLTGTFAIPAPASLYRLEP
ncbi:GNAT family N-acetyltransferase [Streptacidiphilus jiangxiensis]|uniref:Acetyltransferase (GNAT) family protein n=1 Tax=Streptacidiphilus jiangxiensis TaxID=235985 RepID=A0A1H7VAM3_STRJI|nr:GNAT family N-acetyltransferase [Streptacidiphilus jiangxiensis]SEM06333.1 Acetyltransferase (GNAT) family protein [Streptacidiphilus jiangxiensis]